MRFTLDLRRLVPALTLIGVVTLSVIGAAGATVPPTKPPKTPVPPVLKVKPEVVNFGTLPVGTCPQNNFPGDDPTCAAMLHQIDVTNISDEVVYFGGLNMNEFGFGNFNVDTFSRLCDVIQPGESCGIRVFGHVVSPGVSWTYLSFYGACDDQGCTDFAWVKLQVEGK
jgi:hypothetical protein